MKIIRSQTPLRLGLAGGGTDINLYCDKYTGYVLNATISLYIHCTLIPRDDNTIIFDSPDTNSYAKYDSKSHLENDGNLDIYKAVYNRIVKDFTHKPLSFSLHTYSDVPSGSGLGGSSTLVVGVIVAFKEWLNLPLGEYDIAKLAYEIEREDLGIVGGAQDQYAATFGGFNFMEFYDNKRVIVNPLRIKNWIASELESRVVLYFTNITREAKDIEEHKKGKLGDNKSLEAMHAIKQDAVSMKEALFRADFDTIAQILGKSWKSKKIISDIVSNDELDRIYDLAMENGAYSGKTSGAGAGGFMFFLVDPIKKYNLIKILNQQQGYIQDFSFTKEGAKSWKL
ncbi:D-glycero-D-manno-heptose 7-phosphate kinase [Campylobacter hyointestinalis]|uniref:Dehydrogenase n=1 Tax=Campylobacter hyointestinalis subsp. lawsonii TaxID=91353 RepID=A0AAV6ED28_CAMHY|nr:dehydrogenase [Campylobacter hyointestinalis]KAB0612163.1 dehydrogenase [Campylobacter hyointestinalis subsp. lawsonii]QKF69426.1 sugar kinase [Campylobacter hyointestinalis subsp. lawsonii]RAZ23117.1 dehydrogenase [Campylobacter hyointestinalis subsp. lawsonii]RAZ27582.1 dehydrogenase [Campylobacter hyointestinalis subsp. lawsonii]RAZ37650.1 dehydrogenase [Campylobacter hyointestinalis subsp. lawsonii]